MRANLHGTALIDPRSTFRLAPPAREYARSKAAMGTAVACVKNPGRVDRKLIGLWPLRLNPEASLDG